MMKFYLFLHNFSKLWNVYFRVPMGNCLQCYFRQLFISSTFKGSNVLKVILVQGFRPLKTENVQFPLRYRLKSWSVLLMLTYLAGQYWRKHPMIFNEYTRTASAFMSRNRNKTLQKKKPVSHPHHHDNKPLSKWLTGSIICMAYLRPSTLSKTGIQVSGCSVIIDSTSWSTSSRFSSCCQGNN